MEDKRFLKLRPGMNVVGADERPIGTVVEVFRNVGAVETFGTTGIPPQQEGHDPVHYAYSEAMPGWGDDYFVVRRGDGKILYVPFAGISRVDAQAVLAVDAENVDDMNWSVRPDALASLADEYPTDTGAQPNAA
jgi:hypothetical protein